MATDSGKWRTEQEEFWAGDFGNEYIGRNASAEYLQSNVALFSRILKKLPQLGSVIEFGSNIGMNLKALHQITPQTELSAVEINQNAVMELKKWGKLKSLFPISILDFETKTKFDLSFTKTVLIHINPEELSKVYDILYQSSKRYILVAEYYNMTPVEVSYRGHSGKLFKRDFAGELMDRFKDLRLLDYGFIYHRDTHAPQDDISWFLMEKSS